MPLPRVRFTVRRLMAAVAVAGVMLGVAAGLLRLVPRVGSLGKGVAGTLYALAWIEGATGIVLVASIFLWPYTPDPPEPE